MRDKGEVMEVVEGQGRQKVEEYFNKLPQPESMDMHGPFRQAIQMCLPLAKIVVDKFHLIRHVNKAMDKVTSQLQGKHDVFCTCSNSKAILNISQRKGLRNPKWVYPGALCLFKAGEI